ERHVQRLRRAHFGKRVEAHALVAAPAGFLDDVLGEQSAQARAAHARAHEEPLHLASGAIDAPQRGTTRRRGARPRQPQPAPALRAPQGSSASSTSTSGKAGSTRSASAYSPSLRRTSPRSRARATRTSTRALRGLVFLRGARPPELPARDFAMAVGRAQSGR